jgi:hypothetical protein
LALSYFFAVVDFVVLFVAAVFSSLLASSSVLPTSRKYGRITQQRPSKNCVRSDKSGPPGVWIVDVLLYRTVTVVALYGSGSADLYL